MKRPYSLLTFGFLIICLSVNAQYTEVINSNRPGLSISAYSVGKNVVQGEFGIVFERQEHDRLLTESTDFGLGFAVRYGLFFEELELTWEGTYIFRDFQFNGTSPPLQVNNNNFLEHRIGAKYLIFDPFKNEEKNKPNLYSWKANNTFQWKNLIPAISVYAGINLDFSDNPFLPEDASISPRIGVAAQSHLSGRWVLIGNIFYDKISTDDPILSYVLSITHNLKNPKWSVFLENQGINSDAFADISLRGGAARLINKNFQVDASVGMSFKDTPSRLFGTIGVSYRLDYHKDELIKTEPTIKKPKKGYKKKKKAKKGKSGNKTEKTEEMVN